MKQAHVQIMMGVAQVEWHVPLQNTSIVPTPDLVLIPDYVDQVGGGLPSCPDIIYEN